MVSQATIELLKVAAQYLLIIAVFWQIYFLRQQILVLGDQLGVMKKTFEADHERRRKQATIEFLSVVRPMWGESRRRLNDAIGNTRLNEDNLGKILEDRGLQRNVRELLGALERMSVGMQTGVFDKDLLYRMSASYLIRVYDRMRPYILHQQKHKNASAYTEFQELIAEFEKRKRGQPAQFGKVEHS